MAYPHYQIIVPLLTSGGDTVLTANSSGDKGRWFTGPLQTVVRRVGIQKTTTGSWATGAVFSFRKVCGGYASTSGGQIAKITCAASQSLREDGIVFNESFTPTKIPAGYGITVAVTTKATGKLFRAFALVEPSPERLQNFATGYFLSVTG